MIRDFGKKRRVEPRVVVADGDGENLAERERRRDVERVGLAAPKLVAVLGLLKRHAARRAVLAVELNEDCRP